MPSVPPQVERCPLATSDRRKSAEVVGAGATTAAEPVRGYAAVRDVLRAGGMRQAGFKAELVDRRGKLTRPPILYLTGEAHHRQRAATARFFTPRAVNERHRPIMEACADRLIGGLQRSGGGRLDQMALDMAVTVAAQIVGLTESDKRGMIRRLDAFFTIGIAARTDRISRVVGSLLAQWRMLHFHLRDVRPAIAARRRSPREDVISHLIADGYSDSDILVECFTYGAAGMVTTREFVTMAGWHLLEDPALRARFLAGDREDRTAILEEILRLEPVVGFLYRKAEGADAAPLALDIRSANGDAEAVGACPFQLDPDRMRADRVGGAGLAFGDGEHRCPGGGVALAEAEIFLDRLLRIPGLRLARAPDVAWNPLVTGYELRDCRLTIEAVQEAAWTI
jgi:cytochrome P450